MSRALSFGVLFLSLVVSLAGAVSVEYAVQANGVQTVVTVQESQVQECSPCDNVSGNCTFTEVCVNQTVQTNVSRKEPWSAVRVLSLSCELNCDYPLPLFTIPGDVEVFNYTLSAKTMPPRVQLHFKKSGGWVTLDESDQVHLEVNQSVVCSAVQCDPRCTKCLDGSCYPPGYACPSSYLKVERVAPKELGLGEIQLNVLVQNQYQVDIFNVDAKISGAGIKTIRSVPVEKIRAKDKDFVVITVNVQESGTVDVWVKVSATVDGEEVTLNAYDQVTVKAPTVEEEKGSASEAQELSQELEENKEALNELELVYQRKKADGYLVSELYDRIKYIRGMLQDAQKYLLDNRYKEAKKTLALMVSNLDDLRESLERAPKEQKSLKDMIKDNALLITTVIGAIVAVIGFLEKNKERLAKLREKNSGEDKEGKKWLSVEEVKEKTKKKRK